MPGSDTSSFDGFETDITGLQDDYDGPPRTLAANVNLWPRALVIVMNRGAYGRLERRAARGTARCRPRRDRPGPAAHPRARAGGAGDRLQACRAHPALGDPLAARCAAQRDELAHAGPRARSRDPGRCARDRGHARRGGTGAGAGLPARGRPSTAKGETPVDGLWRMNTTADELARIAAPGDVVPENWGESTFALGRGPVRVHDREPRRLHLGLRPVRRQGERRGLDRGGWGRHQPQRCPQHARGEVQVQVEPLPRPARRCSRRRVRSLRSRCASSRGGWLDGEPSIGGLSSRCAPPREALQP